MPGKPKMSVRARGLVPIASGQTFPPSDPSARHGTRHEHAGDGGGLLTESPASMTKRDCGGIVFVPHAWAPFPTKTPHPHHYTAAAAAPPARTPN